MRHQSNLPSLAVEKPEIREILDLFSGDGAIPVEDVIGSDYGKAIALRMESRASIARGEPRFICPTCHSPVYLVSRREARRFFFRHTLEDGRCTAHTRGTLSEEEINARKYNGVKEGLPHQRMKQIIEASLKADPRFSGVAVEATWKGKEPGKLRRPDVKAMLGDLKIAFEIQLSTTYLRVIAERREFYLSEGGLLFWIFKSFEEERPRLTQDDVFYNNNRNLFLASEDTLQLSREYRRLVLECRWAEPFIEDGGIATRWREKIVSIDELTIERESQRVFFFDFDLRIAELTKELEAAPDEALRRRFEQYWINQTTRSPGDEKEWKSLRSLFWNRRISLPTYSWDANGPGPLLNALYSAKHGRPAGWDFSTFIEVAHWLHTKHKNTLWAFGCALRTYGQKKRLLSEDITGKWQRKVDVLRPMMKAGSQVYAPDRRFDSLVSFLFPEMADQLNKYPKEAQHANRA